MKFDSWVHESVKWGLGVDGVILIRKNGEDSKERV